MSRILGRLLFAGSAITVALVASYIVPTGAAVSANTGMTISAMGDSLTLGVSSDRTTDDAGNLRNSWATGSEPGVKSIALRAADATGLVVTPINTASSGSLASDLARQAQIVVGSKPDLVTILSGANDLCSATTTAGLPSAAGYTASVKQALDTISAGSPETRIVIASIPSISKLYAAGMTTGAAPRIWTMGRVCPVMLSTPADTGKAAKARRAAVLEREKQYNASLQGLCAKYANCFTDAGAVYGISLTASDISTRDYFHLSAAGQAKVAAAVWAQVVKQKVLSDLLVVRKTLVYPTVTFSSGSKTAVVSGITRFRVVASSDSRIFQAQVIVKGTHYDMMLAEDGTWYLDVDTKPLSNGALKVYYGAQDSDGEATILGPVSLTVKN